AAASESTPRSSSGVSLRTRSSGTPQTLTIDRRSSASTSIDVMLSRPRGTPANPPGPAAVGSRDGGDAPDGARRPPPASGAVNAGVFASALLAAAIEVIDMVAIV